MELNWYMKEPLAITLQHACIKNIQADLKKHINNKRTKTGKQMTGRLLLTRNKVKAFTVISMLYFELRDEKSLLKHNRGRITQTSSTQLHVQRTTEQFPSNERKVSGSL